MTAVGQRLAESLLANAPASAPDAASMPDVRRDAVADVIWHRIQRQVTIGRVDLLPAYVDHLSCAVMTPVLGLAAASWHAEIPYAAGSDSREVRRVIKAGTGVTGE